MASVQRRYHPRLTALDVLNEVMNDADSGNED